MDRSESQAAFDLALKEQREKLTDTLVDVIGLILIPVSFFVVYAASISGWSILPGIQLAAIGAIWIVGLSKRLLSLRFRATFIGSVLFATAISEVVRSGLLSVTFPIIGMLPVLATVIGGVRWGVVGIIFTMVAVLASGWANAVLPIAPVEVQLPAIEWGVRAGNIAVASAIGIYFVGTLFRFLSSANNTLHWRNTDLLRAQKRLAQSSRLAGLGYAVADLQTGRVRECDEPYAAMHGVTVAEFTTSDIKKEIIGKIIHKDDRPHALEVMHRLQRGEGAISEMRHNMPDGSVRYIRKIFAPIEPDADGEYCCYEIVAQDVTETKLLEQDVAQTQKLDAIGQMTGGMAHDFNNLLAVIMGNLELLREETTSQDNLALIDAGLAATKRGADLTRGMLNFARKAHLRPQKVILNDLVRNAQQWITRTLPSTIRVETSLQQDLWPVEVDVSTAQNALLNLILNARDAMPEGGVLTLETANLVISAEDLDPGEKNIMPGRYVQLVVQDTGHGIPANLLGKIYEPFFTTKPTGSGSGIGLSMVQGFVDQSGGAIRVFSSPDAGTRFEIFFKALDVPQEEADAEAGPEAKVRFAGERILVAEDEQPVRDVIVAMLENTGLKVTSAESGDEALKIFRRDPGFDLLLTDIVMPGILQGTTLSKAMRDIRPDLPVVFISGYASEATVEDNGFQKEDVRLMKPVRKANLIEAVRRALASAKR